MNLPQRLTSCDAAARAELVATMAVTALHACEACDRGNTVLKGKIVEGQRINNILHLNIAKTFTTTNSISVDRGSNCDLQQVT